MPVTLGELRTKPQIDATFSLARHKNFFQILASESFITNRRNGCVKIRKEERGLGSEEPISIPTMLRDISEAYPDVKHHKIVTINLIRFDNNFRLLPSKSSARDHGKRGLTRLTWRRFASWPELSSTSGSIAITPLPLSE